MTNKKPKKEKRLKREIPLRLRGEVIQKQDRPSKVLFDAVLQQEQSESNTTPTTTHHPLPPSTTVQNNSFPISPKRDFTKVANSIVRNAVPSGLFKGTSKSTYDAFYQRTRGAIEPTRKIKAVQSDVLRWANVSHNTLRAHLKHLELVGLLKIHYRLGDNFGAEYEVFLPEEIAIDNPSCHLPPPTTTQQNLGGPTNQKQVVGGGRFNAENISPNEALKTSLKTNTKNDDEPFGAMIEILSQTGKGKREDWRELATLLKMEFDIAASRTKSVTNAPAFLTEHLRRRLIGKSEATKPKANKLTQVGKQQPVEQPEAYKAEPLSEEGRESTLKTFIGYIEKGQKDFLMSLQDTYTKEDWEWLTSKIEEGQQ